MTLLIDHLTKEFVKNSDEPVEVLVDISVEVMDGEFICILGPSGCGKTTLLRIIAGLDHPTSGTVRIDGTVIDRPNRKLGMIFQDYSLYPWRTVNENIAFGLELQGVAEGQRAAIVRNYLALTGLSEFGTSYPYELSGGMRQRIAVVRALAVDPKVLLMDEPSMHRPETSCSTTSSTSGARQKRRSCLSPIVWMKRSSLLTGSSFSPRAPAGSAM
jgi:NitT/TauT family transport system ATP-binding protein